LSIKAISISKTYFPGKKDHSMVEAVKEVSIDINEGSYTLIYGPTGSGKTTLLSLLAGIIKPTRGEVVLKNIHFSSSTDGKISWFRENYIGYIPQNMLLLMDQSVFHNVISPNIFLKYRIKHIKRKAVQILDHLGLKSKINLLPFELSGGEKRKVMIARALLKEPLYLFADEPVSELDDESTDSVLSLFSELQSKGSAVVIASHKPLKFKTLIDFYAIEDGKIKSHHRGKY